MAGQLLPGSDLHTLTAARLMGALRARHGQKDRRTQAAAAAALEVRVWPWPSALPQSVRASPRPMLPCMTPTAHA